MDCYFYIAFDFREILTFKSKKMISILENTPKNIAAFRATGSVTKDDFEKTVHPEVSAKVAEYGELNYLLYLDTDLENFTVGAWIQDIVLGIKNLTHWNRCAIVTNSEPVQKFTDAFSVVVPGEFKSFPIEYLENAIFWCANGDEKEAE